MSTLQPQALVEGALSASRADECVVLVSAAQTVNLRWANNTLTTNGVTSSHDVTVVSIVRADEGTRAASVTRSGVDLDGVAALVEESEHAARRSLPAEDAMPLVAPDTSAGTDGSGWDAAPESTSITAFGSIADGLGEVFANARTAGELRYGYAEQGVATVYLGSSAGVRRRHTQPEVRLELTGRSADGERSAWGGMSARDVAAVDVAAVETEVAQRLAWGRRRLELPAGRYETILPPSAVADLLIYAFWEMGALDAHEGRSVYSRPGGGTRVGESLADAALTLRSDPAMLDQECSPFVAAAASSRLASVFDNGWPLGPTDWIRKGELASLLQTRHSADVTGLPVTPIVDNLELVAEGATGGVEDLVASTDRGLLLTCLWYIREVDPQTLLLTGLTRDGVFLVEDGEVVGAVNNFRFNETPVGMLRRVSAAGTARNTLAREFGDYFTRTRMPALRIAGFNMSSVSQAS